MSLPLANKADLLSDSRRFEKVDVPEWGRAVRLASLGALDWLELREAGGIDDAGRMQPGAMLRLVALSVVDEAGEPVLTPGDVRQLGRHDLKPILALFNRCVALNAPKEDDPAGN